MKVQLIDGPTNWWSVIEVDDRAVLNGWDINVPIIEKVQATFDAIGSGPPHWDSDEPHVRFGQRIFHPTGERTHEGLPVFRS